MEEEEEKNDILEEQELYEHHRFMVDKGQSLMRIDKFIYSRLENVSRNKVQNALRSDNILVNDKAVNPNYRVKPLDNIVIMLPKPLVEFELLPEDIPLKVVYEDDDLIIINKTPGMVVHPAHGNYTGTLLNALLFHLQKINPKAKSYLLHRIDKDTSGILVIAKTEYTQSMLSSQFFHHKVDRLYHALVWGDLDKNEGTIIGNIARSPVDRRVMCVYPDGEVGKHAVTHYKVLERFRYVTLLECKLETGRTHQIRAHMKYIGHTLFGDITYGGDRILKGTVFSKYKQFVENCFALLPRQALHAKTLGFMHPVKKEYVSFESDLPDDMEAVLGKWRKYIENNPS